MNALNCSVLATRLRCESAAPFESPVVPPVYCKKSRSSPHSATGVNGSAPPCVSAAANVITFWGLASIGGAGRAAPMPSPGATLMTCLIAVLPMISASVAEAPLEMMMVSTPASLS